MISGIYSLEELQQTIATYPENWRPLVLTNGCFDLLHVGHLRYLQVAKALGRSLVVGLNSDRSVRQLKQHWPGEPPLRRLEHAESFRTRACSRHRPIVPEMQRAELLCGLKPVDAVIVFDTLTAVSLIEALKPDIYAKGGDYTIDTLPEAPAVTACGCRLELVKVEIPTSTSAIINKILNFR
ncbi:MAG: adenylyltransferase/cytidyltransferase family protein [Hormoscilla sp. SP5CHS1]|nr:adenylyltransferase/cytidyltransferase family protein [Hormoscilla sp. SP12CHS1]MBC6454987.1 adenylyltransferase/cytidyltransferase family protein [Hormoscilla sp. SP5CHS1]